MDTTITIFKAIAAFSVIFSVLFVAVRTYTCYIRKEASFRVKRMQDQCSEDCSCQANTVNDQITDSVTVEKPKRKQVKKRVSAIKDGKLMLEKVSELPAKKKLGRKRKEL
jgi:hypothetical protein